MPFVVFALLFTLVAILCGVFWFAIAAVFIARFSLRQFVGSFLAANVCVVLLLSDNRGLWDIGSSGICMLAAAVVLFVADQVPDAKAPVE